MNKLRPDLYGSNALSQLKKQGSSACILNRVISTFWNWTSSDIPRPQLWMSENKSWVTDQEIIVMFSNTFFSHQTKQCFFSNEMKIEMNKRVQLYIEIRAFRPLYYPESIPSFRKKKCWQSQHKKKLNLGFKILRCFDLVAHSLHWEYWM